MAQVRAGYPARPGTRVAGLRAIVVGHAMLLIQAGGVNILTDPISPERTSPLTFAGPKRVTAPGIPFENLPPIDAVLLNHCQYDHFDVTTLRQLQGAHDPLFAMPLGNDAILRGNVPGARCLFGDWWDRLEIADRFSTRLTPANHWANRWPFDVRMALWSGHYLATPAGSIWFTGDTGYGDGQPSLAPVIGAPDLALIPVGAYEPGWFMAAQHCNPAEAVCIMLDVRARRALGIHWGTFQLTDEAGQARARRSPPCSRRRACRRPTSLRRSRVTSMTLQPIEDKLT